MTAPAETEEATQVTPRTPHPRVRPWDVVSVTEIDGNETSEYLTSDYFDTEEHLAMISADSSGMNRAYDTREISEAGRPHSLVISDWNIVQPRNTPAVAVGDYVYIHATREGNYFRNPASYEHDQAYPVSDVRMGSELYVTTTNVAGQDNTIAVMSWTKAGGPSDSVMLRPTVAVGMKAKALLVSPAKYLTDGTIGDGVGVVVRTKRGERPRVVFTSTTGAKKEMSVNSWEVVPFDDVADELACFKEATYWLAKSYGKQHSMCSQLDAALEELQLLPNREFKVTISAKIGDIQGEVGVFEFFQALNNKRTKSEWPKGTIVEITKDGKKPATAPAKAVRKTRTNASQE